MEPTQSPVDSIDFHPKSRLLVFVLSVVGIVLLITIVFLYLQNQKLQQKVINQQITSTIQAPTSAPATESLTSTPPDEMEGWKTYENSEYKFKFKYPANWISGKKDGNLETTLSNQENTHKINLFVEFVTGFGYCYNYSDEEEINVVGIPSKTANGTGPSDMCSDKEKINGTGNTYVLIPIPTDSSQGKKIYFDYTYSINEISKAKINLYQILSTFKFVDKKKTIITVTAIPIPTSTSQSIRNLTQAVIPGWATYSGFNNGLTFQYPPGFRQLLEAKEGSACVLTFTNDAGGVFQGNIAPYDGGSRRVHYGRYFPLNESGYTYTFEDVYILGAKALIIEKGPIGDSGSGTAVIVPKGKHALILDISNRAKDSETFQNILKSISAINLSGGCG